MGDSNIEELGPATKAAIGFGVTKAAYLKIPFDGLFKTYTVDSGPRKETIIW